MSDTLLKNTFILISKWIDEKIIMYIGGAIQIQYLPLCKGHMIYTKWRVLGFTHHFVYITWPLQSGEYWILLATLHFIAWLYFSTMHILWDRPSQYDVLLIIHATKVILKSLVYDSWFQMTFVAFMMSKTSYWDGLLTGYLQY